MEVHDIIEEVEDNLLNEREKYVFIRWNPEVAEKIQGNAIYTAVWEEDFNENGIVHQKWSPKRMDEFEAYEEQLEYLSQHPEFIKTYKVIQRDYMQEIGYSYYKLQQSDYAYKDYYLDVLSGKMRTALKKYSKSAGITIKEHTNYYEIAGLKRVNFFWKYQAVKRKLIKR